MSVSAPIAAARFRGRNAARKRGGRRRSRFFRHGLEETSFMLLEVILATALLAIGLFGIIDSLGRCVAAAKSIQSYATSEILLANKSFEFRAERGSDIFDQEGTFNDYPGYSWSRRLERTDTDGLWKQTIEVFWRERGNIVSDWVVEYRYLPEKQQ